MVFHGREKQTRNSSSYEQQGRSQGLLLVRPLRKCSIHLPSHWSDSSLKLHICLSVCSNCKVFRMFQVGDIPQGLPKFSLPKSFDHAKLLLPTAALITGVAILVRYNLHRLSQNGYRGSAAEPNLENL